MQFSLCAKGHECFNCDTLQIVGSRLDRATAYILQHADEHTNDKGDIQLGIDKVVTVLCIHQENLTSSMRVDCLASVNLLLATMLALKFCVALSSVLADLPRPSSDKNGHMTYRPCVQRESVNLRH
jgi:hypothetical protein